MFSYSNLSSRSDRYRVNGISDIEVQELAEKLRYPLEDIFRAIQEVGYEAEDIEEYIRDRYNRS
ncbi:MAG TPA: DUF3606 domain-containing protein [Flavisolibacter sp.]|jgi:hypothetical protein|nr:DUF3606 domain-containing protein [Flavisolibacter sp.]